MKHLREFQHEMISTTTPTSSSPNPRKKSNGTRKQSKSSKENAPPQDPNSMSSPMTAAKLATKSPLPPRPPNSHNHLKRKLSVESAAAAECGATPGSSDSGVRVVVRMRPANKDEEEGEMIVHKISENSLTIAGHTFTFDSVADPESTQLDVFNLVGVPLVENCLAGFNSSVFAYGQTGSGKTYTIWGPANALLEKNLSSDQQGLTPRVFEHLFARIREEQIKHADKQLSYQCRCSFLEIYNEQITDLLDPTQGNLQIREDVKTGVYVENLTEECVSTMKQITQLLIKGLSNRRTGSTSINAESSRSHSVFTCVVESRCKRMPDGLSFLKTSRINLVDLAGSERQKLTGAAGERLKEAGNINRSLSQLGNLINILAEVSQSGKQRHIPYRDSKLTFLLQESLGGNAKLAMVCAISPAQSCKSETFSTLRFAQRAKAIKNKAVVNEEMQDDVNVLREVIRQLKEELLRMKANGNQPDQNGSCSNAWSARRSLNLIKFSLNRPMTLPHLDDDSDEEMEIVEDVEVSSVKKENNMDVCQLETVQQTPPFVVLEGGSKGQLMPCSGGITAGESGPEDTYVSMEEMCEQVGKQETHENDCGGIHEKVLKCSEAEDQTRYHGSDENVNSSLIYSPVQATWNGSFSQSSEKPCFPPCADDIGNEKLSIKPIATKNSVEETHKDSPKCLSNGMASTSLSIVPCDVSSTLKSPTPSVSPKVNNSSRKSLRTSSTSTSSKKNHADSKMETKASHLSFCKPSNSIALNSLSCKKSKSCLTPTEHLAASLHHGLEILDSYRRSVAMRRSSFRFSCKPADMKAIVPVTKIDVGIQTNPDVELLEEDSVGFSCSKCRNRNSRQELKDASDSHNLELVPVDVSHSLLPVNGSQSCDKLKKQVPKAVEKVLAGAIRREMALEEICTKQTSEIMQLNRLIQQFKHERECNAIIGQTREDKIIRLENLMDGILTSEEFMEEEVLALTQEHKLLKEKYENHPEVLSMKIELRRVQDELEKYQNFFDMGERDVLLEEIQDLRSQLQYYIDFTPKPPRKQSPALQLISSCEHGGAIALSSIPESSDEAAEQRFEQERIQCTETENKWISVVEDLRLELEASRKLAQKQKIELDLEKKCSEELNDALQMAMESNTRMLEQYVELEEKHMQLLERHRKIRDGIDDVKKAAARAGVRGAESKFINALAAEISALKAEREKERRFFRDENKGLQAQLRDTAEAVQAAGELLVRLKEAEEATDAARRRAVKSESETDMAYKQMDKLKKEYEEEINALHQLLAESRLPKEAPKPVYDDVSQMEKLNAAENHSAGDDQRWREEFEPFYTVDEGELSRGHSSWFSGYDRCNI